MFTWVSATPATGAPAESSSFSAAMIAFSGVLRQCARKTTASALAASTRVSATASTGAVSRNTRSNSAATSRSSLFIAAVSNTSSGEDEELASGRM